jgi:hypothetical protein
VRRAGGAFGAPAQVSPDGQIALWPDVAVDDAGEVLVGWLTNDSGAGSGNVEATLLKSGPWDWAASRCGGRRRSSPSSWWRSAERG